MNIAVIIQARMGSTRLPGKVMKKIGDMTVLGHVISRCKKIPSIHQVIVATTNLDEDNVICQEAIRNGVTYYRGSDYNVLERYYEAALSIQCDHIIRVTSDCPFIDPCVVEGLIQYYQKNLYDYARVGLDCFPRGLDAEIFSFNMLKYSMEHAESDFEREHVTQYILQKPNQFKKGIYHDWKLCFPEDSSYRLTLDTTEDWTFIQAVYAELADGFNCYSWKEIRSVLLKSPNLALINANIEQQHPTT